MNQDPIEIQECRIANGKKTPVRTKTSHGSSHRDIGSEIASRMARQCRLSSGDFERLVDCSLSQAEYEELLTRQQAI